MKKMRGHYNSAGEHLCSIAFMVIYWYVCICLYVYAKWNSASNLIFNHGMNKSKTKTQKYRERAHSSNLMYIAFRRANVQWFLFIVNIISIRAFALLTKATHSKTKQNNEWKRTSTQKSTPKCTWLQMDERVWIVRTQSKPTFSMHAQTMCACVFVVKIKQSIACAVRFMLLSCRKSDKWWKRQWKWHWKR